MTTEHDIILNQNQRRALGITLALVDETLCRIQEWAKGREVHSVLYQEQNRLAPAQRRLLARRIARMRRTLERLREDLHLPKQTRSASDDIWARCAALRESLMELEGRRLRGYGEVDPTLAACLSSQVPGLLQGLDRIVSVVSGKARAK
jgi:hypothetical protein